MSPTQRLWKGCLNFKTTVLGMTRLPKQTVCFQKWKESLSFFLKKKNLIKSDNWLIWDRGHELFSLIFYLSNCPFLSGVVVLKPASRCASCGWFVQLANTLKNAPSKGGEKNKIKLYSNTPFNAKTMGIQIINFSSSLFVWISLNALSTCRLGLHFY